MFQFEMIPLVAGVIVGLIGLAILADAWIPEGSGIRTNRRRQERVERSTGGEACIGLAVLCMAAVLIGRDRWPYVTVAMIGASLLFLIGLAMNWSYLKGRLVNRGELRRGKPPGRR